MSAIIDEFNKKSHFYCEKGASEEMIRQAEMSLGLRFADDYREYLKVFGSVSCGGHELTGFSEDNAIDVVNSTLQNLKNNPSIKQPLYVVEETHIDGIVIWQSEAGIIFQTEYKGEPEQVYKSLTEYVSTFEDKEE